MISVGKQRECGIGTGNFAEQNHDIIISGTERVLEVI